MSTENKEIQNVNEATRYECTHNNVGVSNIRLYREVKASLVRTKNAMIDEIMESEMNLDENLQQVAEVIDSYERMRMVFKHYIFEGDIPSQFLREDGDEEEENTESETDSDDDAV